MQLARWIVSPFLALMAGAAAAQTMPPIREGSSYAAARGVLIAKGFRPVPSGEQGGARCSAGRQDVCAAYPETVSCSGTGAGSCNFIFADSNGNVLTLTTVGEDLARLRVASTRRAARRDLEWQQKGRSPQF